MNIYNVSLNNILNESIHNVKEGRIYEGLGHRRNDPVNQTREHVRAESLGERSWCEFCPAELAQGMRSKLVSPNIKHRVGASEVLNVGSSSSSSSAGSRSENPREAEAGSSESSERADREPVRIESEESRKPRVARRPNTPTRAEVEEHLPLHIEYRSWCPHCVAGRGVSDQHRTNTGEKSEDLGATVSLD